MADFPSTWPTISFTPPQNLGAKRRIQATKCAAEPRVHVVQWGRRKRTWGGAWIVFETVAPTAGKWLLGRGGISLELQSSHRVTSVMGLRKRLMNLLLRLPWSGTRRWWKGLRRSAPQGWGWRSCRPARGCRNGCSPRDAPCSSARSATPCSLTLCTSPGTCRGPSGPWSSPVSERGAFSLGDWEPAGRKAGWKFGRKLTHLPGEGAGGGGAARITFYYIRDHDEPFWLGEVFPFSASQVVTLTCVCLLGVTNNVVLEAPFLVGIEGSLEGRYVLKISELSLVISWLIEVEERGTDLDQKFFPIFH